MRTIFVGQLNELFRGDRSIHADIREETNQDSYDSAEQFEQPIRSLRRVGLGKSYWSPRKCPVSV